MPCPQRGGLSSPRRPLLCVPPPKPASRLLLPTPPDTLRPSATSPRWPSHRRTAASPRTTPRGPDGGLRTTARAAPTATGALGAGSGPRGRLLGASAAPQRGRAGRAPPRSRLAEPAAPRHGPTTSGVRDERGRRCGRCGSRPPRRCGGVRERAEICVPRREGRLFCVSLPSVGKMRRPSGSAVGGCFR